ncbi:histidine phosphatase family protein [Nisaea denitrificans]|uniref:histidine phosphatase family protein n=1 Tax=Nisaea denitrificans TaxID=390877 RepID=UPI00068865AF|nr:histidine phosphatase family protein [Nisaea denitrificans]
MRQRSKGLYFLTHADVVIDPAIAVTDWGLSERGRERIRAGLVQPWLPSVTAIWSSAERKALDTAEILADHLGLDVQIKADLGENDRTSTGYLPRAEFERTADAFFANPKLSVRGWAPARVEQGRIVAACDAVGHTEQDGTPLIVSHGAVGALLLAHLLGQPVSRELDQPRNEGGNWFSFRDTAPCWKAFDIE